MKKCILLMIMSCYSLQGMRQLVSLARFSKPSKTLKFQAQKYSVYTEHNGFSCNNLEDVLEMYAKRGKNFIDDLYCNSYADVNLVKRLIKTELERCKETGSAPDMAILEIMGLMIVRTHHLEPKDGDARLKWYRDNVSNVD